MEKKLQFIDLAASHAQQTNQSGIEHFEYAHKAEITNLYPLTATEKLYQIQIINQQERKNFNFRPGQFVMLELPGIGEAPFSISSSPIRHGDLELCIRGVGKMTNFLNRVQRGIK